MTPIFIALGDHSKSLIVIRVLRVKCDLAIGIAKEL